MSRSRLGALVGGFLVVAAARAEIDVTLLNGDMVRGTLLPATEVESFRVACPEGARIAVAVRARARGLRVGATLFDADGVAVVGRTGRSVRIGGVEATRSGTYRVDVTSGDAISTGDYTLRVRWTSPRRFAATLPVEGRATGELPFAADAGARVALSVAAPKGSGAAPSLLRVAAEDGTMFPLDPGARGSFVVPSAGKYTLTFENTSDAAGPVAVRAAVVPPKAPARRLSATTREIPAGTNVVAAAVIDAQGGTLRAPGSGPLANARVTVPEGALAAPAIVVVGAASDLTPPLPSNSTRATATAFVGPLGASFAGAARPSVVVPVSLGGTVPLDAGLRVYAGADGDVEEVPGASTDGATVTFEAPRLTSFQGYYVAQPEIAEPLVFDTMSDRSLGATAIGGGFAFVASPYSFSYLSGGPVGEGLVRVFERVGSTWAERAPLRSPTSIDRDGFGVSLCYRRGSAGAGGDSLLVSARDADGPGVGGTENPAIFEFTLESGAWTHTATVPAAPGYVFAADGDRLAVLPNLASGVSTFVRSGASWTAGDAVALPELGVALGVDVRGDTLLAGVPIPYGGGAGAAYRIDLSVTPAASVARYGAPAPEQAGNRFARTVVLGAEYLAVLGPERSQGLEVFRLSDDARDASITQPILPAYGSRSPYLTGSFDLEGRTLVVAAGTYLGGWPFAGAYVYRRSGTEWPRTFTLDAAPAIGSPGAIHLPGSVALGGTTVLVPVNTSDYSGGPPYEYSSSVAFFELPPE